MISPVDSYVGEDIQDDVHTIMKHIVDPKTSKDLLAKEVFRSALKLIAFFY
jgi:hypothetical protein